MAIGNGGLDWARYAECAKPENDHIKDNFFSGNAEKKYIAKNLCFTCDVREDCIRWALEKPEIWGIWGGRDEDEIRRNLSVDAEGKEIRRGRFPQCGKCSARTSMLRVIVEDLPDGGRWTTAKYVVCTNCDFRWRSRSSANAVEAYHAQVAEKRSRAERARIRKSNLKKTAKK